MAKEAVRGGTLRVEGLKRGEGWCLGASPRTRNYGIPTDRVVPAFVRYGSVVVRESVI